MVSEKFRSKGRTPSLGAIFLTVFLDLIGFGIVMPFLALEAREIYGVSEGVATLLGASYSLAQFFFVPFWGRLSDTIGRRPVLIISVFFSAVTMVCLGLALAYGDSIVWLFMARIFGGIATANLGTASAYIADITPSEDRVKGMGMIGMAFGLGFIIGPGLGGFLATFPVNGHEGPMACFVAGALSFVNFVWVLMGLPESLPPEKRSEIKRSLSPLNFEAIGKVFSHPFLGRAVLTNFLIILAFSGLEITFAFYAKDAFALTSVGVGWLFVFMGVVAALVQGGFMRRAGKLYEDSKLAMSGLWMQCLAFFGIMFAPGFGLWALVLASAVLAIGNGLTQPSLSGFISRRSQSQEQGMVLSTHHSFASLARVFGPALGGFCYEYFGESSPFLVGGIINGLGIFVALKLLSSPMRQEESSESHA